MYPPQREVNRRRGDIATCFSDFSSVALRQRLRVLYDCRCRDFISRYEKCGSVDDRSRQVRSNIVRCFAQTAVLTSYEILLIIVNNGKHIIRLKNVLLNRRTRWHFITIWILHRDFCWNITARQRSILITIRNNYQLNRKLSYLPTMHMHLINIWQPDATCRHVCREQRREIPKEKLFAIEHDQISTANIFSDRKSLLQIVPSLQCSNRFCY